MRVDNRRSPVSTVQQMVMMIASVPNHRADSREQVHTLMVIIINADSVMNSSPMSGQSSASSQRTSSRWYKCPGGILISGYAFTVKVGQSFVRITTELVHSRRHHHDKCHVYNSPIYGNHASSTLIVTSIVHSTKLSRIWLKTKA